MSIMTLAKICLGTGIVLIIVGGGLYLLAQFNIPLGRLPGDIVIERENFKFVFPVATSIILSIVLTVGLNLLIRLIKK